MKKQNESYVINLHILESCNYRCKYCFAHFGSKKILSLDEWKRIIDNISSSIDVKRFNIAGGEPLLYPNIDELIQYIKLKGIEVSIITNGVLLSESFIKKHEGILDTIGISMDSLSEEVLLELGCKTSNGKFLTKEMFFNIAKSIKQHGMELKVNTVVTKSNFNDILAEDLSELGIDRWKILKMKPFKTSEFNNHHLDITTEEFYKFIDNNKDIKNIVIEESMVNSYIIIDSQGFLVDNSSEEYVKVADAKSDTFTEDFLNFNLDKELYSKRYIEQ